MGENSVMSCEATSTRLQPLPEDSPGAGQRPQVSRRKADVAGSSLRPAEFVGVGVGRNLPTLARSLFVPLLVYPSNPVGFPVPIFGSEV